MILRGKRILLLAPIFFGYEIEIKKELEALGASVLFFDERPKNDFFTKAAIRLNLKQFIAKRIERYYSNIVNAAENIDAVFLVAPETISRAHLQKIKAKNPEAKVYVYFWDSIRNKKSSPMYVKLADHAFSFDSGDVKAGSNISFLPLFYIRDYGDIKASSVTPMYDLAFIGTAHSDRYQLIKKIEQECKLRGLTMYSYFYSPSKILFLFQWLFKKEFRQFALADISFKSLSKAEVLGVIQQSRAVVDIHHPLQTGLTMRSIEMLGAARKLLTTNVNVASYDFYNANNIQVFDRKKLEINYDFLSHDYQPVPDVVYEKYSLKNWLLTVFSAKDN